MNRDKSRNRAVFINFGTQNVIWTIYLLAESASLTKRRKKKKRLTTDNSIVVVHYGINWNGTNTWFDAGPTARIVALITRRKKNCHRLNSIETDKIVNNNRLGVHRPQRNNGTSTCTEPSHRMWMCECGAIWQYMAISCRLYYFPSLFVLSLSLSLLYSRFCDHFELNIQYSRCALECIGSVTIDTSTLMSIVFDCYRHEAIKYIRFAPLQSQQTKRIEKLLFGNWKSNDFFVSIVVLCLISFNCEFTIFS